ncbi:hypothetical protein EES43_23690 [Streptomyces sp. ADI96-02]|uniref:hypothetical protein n=1 Tax=Streptomyces sp. ADI96-02 TaxID=1522760 RepID=UPI000F555667|nr:hypothetical protein [Streptomyces sp. ADI96-02]RPK56828.1 hypothetical protein EES43_23690 [Streptomyces sp. ADI96-02]
MIYAPYTSAFASVRQHFDNPRIKDAPVLAVTADADAAGPVQLTATAAHTALYGPETDPRLSAAIWDAALAAARADATSDGTAKLLVILLALPMLSGTVHRICGRLRADRSDVEAEMILTLLSELAALDPAPPLSITPLVKAARNRAWNFAREGLREIPSTQVERISQDRALVPAARTTDDVPPQQALDVQVDRPDGPEGLRAPLRFRVRPEHVREEALVPAAGGATACCPRSRRRSRRRVGTLPIRPFARRP